MFRFINKDKQLLNANAEIARLRSIVGELPQVEKVEDTEEVTQPTLSDKVVSIEETIDTVFGG